MTDIDDLGTRLVKESQDRRDQIRRRQERYEKRAAIASLVLPLGAKIIEDGLIQKSQDFFNSENVLNLTREYNKAAANSAGRINTEQQIQNSGGDAESYFEDQNFEAAKTQLIDLLTEEQKGGREMLNMAEIDMRARTIARDMAIPQAKEHNESLAIALNLPTREEFHTERDRVLKPTTPTTITGWLGRGVTTALGGDSTQERQATAIQDFKQSGQFETISHLNTAVDEFKATNNWRSAFSKAAEDSSKPEVSQYWKDKIDEITGMEEYKPDKQTQASIGTGPDGRRTIDIYSFDVDVNGNMLPETVEAQKNVVLSESTEAQMLFNSRVKQALEVNFNPRTDATPFLTQEGYKEFRALVRENTREDGSSISLNDWQTPEEHSLIRNIFDEYMENNQDNKTLVIQNPPTQSELIIMESRLKGPHFQNLERELTLRNVDLLRNENPEEFEAAKQHYIKTLLGSDEELVEPTNYGNLRSAVKAEHEWETLLNRILNYPEEGIPHPEFEEANNQVSNLPELEFPEGSLTQVVGGEPDPQPEPDLELDWPDDYKLLKRPTQRAMYEKNKKAKIQGYRNRLAVNDNQADRDELAKLEGELEQYLAMRNRDTTTSFGTFAGSGA